jgi:outer membrane protein
MISKVRSLTVNSKLLAWPALILAAALSAQAQTKVAVINIQGAIVSTKDGQKAAAELNAKTAPKKKELDLKQGDINSLQDQLTKGQNTLSETAKNDLYKNIEQKKKSLQRDVEDAQADLEQEQQKVLQGLGQKILAVIERYARDNGYTLVVDVSSPQTPVLYASPSIDITKDIIELYDKSAAAVSAPAPKPSAAPGTAPGAAPAPKPAAPPKPAPAPAKPPGQ